MALTSALKDRARTIRREAAGVRVQGMTPRAPTSSQWFKARLELPANSEQTDAQGGRRKQVKRPTLMLGVKDLDRNPVVIKAEEQIEVDSEELGRAIWRVSGDPQPIRKKKRLIGWQATLERAVEPKADRL